MMDAPAKRNFNLVVIFIEKRPIIFYLLEVIQIIVNNYNIYYPGG